MKSEFGSGFLYSLMLFAFHMDSAIERMKKEHDDHTLQLWINGASDHMYELVIPKTLPEKLQAKLHKFRASALNYGHGHGMLKFNLENYRKMRKQLESIIVELDNHLFQIKVKRATYG
jgi:hypothetical protein